MASKYEYNRWVVEGKKLKGTRGTIGTSGKPSGLSKFEKIVSGKSEDDKPKVDMVFDAFKDIMED
jgi:hypothetical protein